MTALGRLSRCAHLIVNRIAVAIDPKPDMSGSEAVGHGRLIWRLNNRAAERWITEWMEDRS